MELDRFEIEEVGQNPAKLAAAIHKQLGVMDRPIPVADIAYALDIKSIEMRPLTRCEGALIMPRNKSKGAIAVKEGARSRRTRFTIAHELGHFINCGHLPPRNFGDGSFGFECNKADMRAKAISGKKKLTPAQRKEVEANQFAAELLMPRYRLRPFLRTGPNLQQVLDIATTLEVSREAAANRYVSTHDEPIAIVFSKNGYIRYIAKADDFPRTLVWNKERLPETGTGSGDGLSDIVETEATSWLTEPKSESIEFQTLSQSRGYQMTLLIGPEEEDETDGLENSYDRFERFQ